MPYEQFLATLELAVDVELMAEGDVARVAQLLYRTNQFNAAGRRRTEGEVAALASTGLETFVVRVRDRFGDYGTTGAVIARFHEDCLVVDAFVATAKNAPYCAFFESLRRHAASCSPELPRRSARRRRRSRPPSRRR